MDPVTRFRALFEIVGDDGVLTKVDDLRQWGDDWSKSLEPRPLVVVLPRTTDEVVRVVRWCAENRLAVVPSGGRTGLAGGAVAMNGEVVVSLSRMNRIEEINEVGLFARVEAGVTTQALQEAAATAGLFFPLDLAAKGTAAIGGNIATNAGGLKLIRYGGMRELTLGLEVVLATGEVLDLNRALRKNNTGYDLRQLFVGSEGTLGIITRATVRLVTKPQPLHLACLGVSSFADIPKILGFCNRRGVKPMAFEFFSAQALKIVLAEFSARPPFLTAFPYNLLLEVEEGALGEFDSFESILEALLADGLIADAVPGQSSTEYADLWALRENITEAQSHVGRVRKNDVSVPVDRLSDLVCELENIIVGLSSSELRIVLFGHIGDGNVHLNYVAPESMAVEAFAAEARSIEERVFSVVTAQGGSISAEHGIGLLKKHDLHFSRTPFEIDVMRRIKRIFDPLGIMNPGKIFDAAP